jgi:hypothetical protein
MINANDCRRRVSDEGIGFGDSIVADTPRRHKDPHAGVETPA